MKNKTDAFAQNRRLGRGVNIIGYDQALWSTGKGRFQDKHFHLIREAGFNHVRINLHPFKHMDDAPDYVIAPGWLRTLDWAVTQALDNGLVVILDMHEFNAMARNFENLKAKYLAVWEQLAERYQDYP
ncbi:MAG: cellulase family glycosylhydrolase, partial [Anaerolineae bacterium]|nr:cellulase family glycosylhydrolase [Anaerolineae bacterium]